MTTVDNIAVYWNTVDQMTSDEMEIDETTVSKKDVRMP